MSLQPTTFEIYPLIYLQSSATRKRSGARRFGATRLSTNSGYPGYPAASSSKSHCGDCPVARGRSRTAATSCVLIFPRSSWSP
jgi:hypothetical protein